MDEIHRISTGQLSRISRKVGESGGNMCRKKLFEYVEFHDVFKDPQSREYVDFLNNYENNKSS